MTVYVLVGIDGYVWGVFYNEQSAYDFANREVPGICWDVVEKIVQD